MTIFRNVTKFLSCQGATLREIPRSASKRFEGTRSASKRYTRFAKPLRGRVGCRAVGARHLILLVLIIFTQLTEAETIDQSQSEPVNIWSAWASSLAFEGSLLQQNNSEPYVGQGVHYLVPPAVLSLNLKTKLEYASILFSVSGGTPLSNVSWFISPSLGVGIPLGSTQKYNIELHGRALHHMSNEGSYVNSPLGGNSLSLKALLNGDLVGVMGGNLVGSLIGHAVMPGRSSIGGVEETGKPLEFDNKRLLGLGARLSTQFSSFKVEFQSTVWNLGITAIASKNFGVTLPAEYIVQSSVTLAYAINQSWLVHLNYYWINAIDDPLAFANRSMSAYDPYLSSKSHLLGGLKWLF